MKQKDIALIIVVAFVAGVFSLLLSQALFVSKKQRSLQAEVVDPITSEFSQPDKNVFNPEAINPTQLIQIGENSNPSPF